MGAGFSLIESAIIKVIGINRLLSAIAPAGAIHFPAAAFGASNRLISSTRQRLVCIIFLLPLAAFVAVASMREQTECWCTRDERLSMNNKRREKAGP